MREPIRVRHLRQSLQWAATALDDLREALDAGILSTPLKCPPIVVNPPVYDKCLMGEPREIQRLDDVLGRLGVTVRSCAHLLGGLAPDLVVESESDATA